MAVNGENLTVKSIMMASSVLRGYLPVEQIVETIIAFTFLRRIDCLIEKSTNDCQSFYATNRERLSDERLDKGLRELTGRPFYNFSGYTLAGILLSSDNIEITLNSYLEGFSPNVREIFDGMNFKHTVAVLQRQPRLLVEMIEFFTSVELYEESFKNEEFVELVSSVIMNASGSRSVGEHFTNAGLSDLICECLLDVDLRDSKNESVSIYDPVCGTGSMLAKAGSIAKIFVINQDKVSLYGQEISVFPSAVAKAFVLLVGNENSEIQYGDTLVDDKYRNRCFQYIMGDMPFGLRWRHIKERIEIESLDLNGRFNIGLPGSGDSQFLFIEHMISKMDPRGSRAAFVSTASVLWGGNAKSGESRIRRWLFENDLVETIISLPAGVHTMTSIPLYLWILTNKKNKSQVGKVRLINATSLSRENRRGGIDSSFVNAIVEEYKSKVLSVNSQIINNDKFGFYELNLLENGKKSETITIPLDTDVNDFVARERQPFAKGEITVDYSSVEKGYTVQFENFFTQEQTDVANLVEATKELIPVIEAVASLKTDLLKIVGRADSIESMEYPLRAVAQIALGAAKPQTLDAEGLPLLSLAYLRKPCSDENLYEVTQRTKCSSVKDVIVVVRGENSGEVFRGVDGILSPSIAAIKCTDESSIVPQYMYYYLKANEKNLRSLAKGATIKSIDSKSILDFKCMIPSVDEQLRLASFLDEIIGKIDNILIALDSSNNVFSAYRQTLIENVIFGRVLVK